MRILASMVPIAELRRGRPGRFFGFSGLLGLALLLAGCASSGPVNNPIGSTLTWFSYVGGDDIRSACQAGGPAHWRLVYNGNYQQQVRAYDLVADADGGIVMQSRVTGSRDVSLIDLKNPFAPWEPTFHQRLLSPPQAQHLEQAIVASGFDAPAPDGTFLRSDGYYWVVSACRNGHFHLNAWAAPAADLRQLRFVPELLRLDGTGIAYNLPARINLPPYGSGLGDPSDPNTFPFRLQVGRNGLR